MKAAFLSALSMGVLGVVDASFWSNLTAMLGAMFSHRQPAQNQDPAEALKDLQFRLRHPLQDALNHPIVSLRRKIDRRRSA